MRLSHSGSGRTMPGARAEAPGTLVKCPFCPQTFAQAKLALHVRSHYYPQEQQGRDKRRKGSSSVQFVMPGPEPAVPTAPWGGVVPPVPVFRPTAEEFADPLAYISSIADVGRRYGLCRIVPPSSVWKMPKTPLPETLNQDKLLFHTKIQNVHQLKHRGSHAQMFLDSLEAWQDEKSYDLPMPPVVDKCMVDLWDLLCVIVRLFGPNPSQRGSVDWNRVLRTYMEKSLLSGRAMQRHWRGMRPGDDLFKLRALKVREVYLRYLQEYEMEACASPERAHTGLTDEDIAGFGYAEGELQSVATFRGKAEEVARSLSLTDASVEDFERLYWTMLESPDAHVEVEYANDLSVVQYGSAFPTAAADPMARHPWNLNVLPKRDASLFHHTTEVIHGVTDPMLYFGMAFTSFAWHVEDHFLYSINYHHGGAPKVWYGVGSQHADDLERVMKAELPELFDKHPDLLHQLVTMISPLDLQRNRIPVFKAVQEPGDFVVTFPRGYHAGFNTGFNLAEAVNFAMPDWLPFGVASLANYKRTKRLCAFSHEELILSCARSFPVTHVAVQLLSELYRLTCDYEQLRFDIHSAGVSLFMKANDCTDILHCEECRSDCYFACVQCNCDVTRRVCLACYVAHKIEWCKGTCEGSFLYERVGMDVLESLVQKLETRMDLQGLCGLRGGDRRGSLAVFLALRPAEATAVAPSRASQRRSAASVVHRFDTALLPLVRRVARVGGLRELSESDITSLVAGRAARHAFYFVEDSASVEEARTPPRIVSIDSVSVAAFGGVACVAASGGGEVIVDVVSAGDRVDASVGERVAADVGSDNADQKACMHRVGGLRTEEDTEDKGSLPLVERTARRPNDAKRVAVVDLVSPPRPKRVVIDLTGMDEH